MTNDILSAAFEITVLDGTGDTLLRWSKKDDPAIKERITELLRKGSRFCVVEPQGAGATLAERPITRADHINNRAVIDKDDAFQAMADKNSVEVVTSFQASKADIARYLPNNPEEIMAAAERNPGTTCKVVVLAPMAGG